MSGSARFGRLTPGARVGRRAERFPRPVGNGQGQLIEVAGFQRLRLLPFDPSRDTLTEHEQTDARLLAMFGQLDAPEFDTEDARAFCRLFAGFVRAAQVIMFEKRFMRARGCRRRSSITSCVKIQNSKAV